MIFARACPVTRPKPGCYHHGTSSPKSTTMIRVMCWPAIAFAEKFFYLPNQFWQHKNHQSVFRAVERFERAGRVD